MEPATSKPLRVFFCAGVTCTVWITPRVRGDKVVDVPSIKFDKSYEVEGQRKYTTTFYDEDLPKIALLAMEAYRFLKVRSVEPNESQEEE
jgi:hypothetical protein